MKQWQQFQIMATQLLPSRGAILVTMTSQGCMSPPEKQTSIHWTVDALVLSVAIILYNKIDLSFLCKHGGFLQIQSHNNESTQCDHKLIFST